MTPLTPSMASSLSYWWQHGRRYLATTNLDFDLIDRRQTLDGLVRRGLAERVRRDGRSYVANLTDAGRAEAERIGMAEEVVAAAERITRESAPTRVLERRWDESLGLRGTHVNMQSDGRVIVHVTLPFANEDVAEKFRLDMAGVFLSYRRRKHERGGDV